MAIAGFGWSGTAAEAGGSKPRIYVSLGDSLAASFQPGPASNHKGYVEDLWRDLRGDIAGLTHQKFGCAWRDHPDDDRWRSLAV